MFTKPLTIICLLLILSVPTLFQMGKGNGLPDMAVIDNRIFLYQDFGGWSWDPMPGFPEVIVAAFIYNEGEQVAKDFVVTFFLDSNFDRSMDANEIIKSKTVDQLPSSNSTTLAVEWTNHPYDIGAFQICVNVNPLGQSHIAESNHNNNMACRVFEIRGNEIDYVPTVGSGLGVHYSYVDSPLIFPYPHTLYVQEKDTIMFWIGIRNGGSVRPSNESSIAVFINSDQGHVSHFINVKPIVASESRYPWECPNGTPKYMFACPSLKPLGYSYELNWTAEYPTSYYFRISVDYFDQVQETNESNNEITFKIEVQKTPVMPLEEEEKENWSPVIAALLASFLSILGYSYTLKGRTGSTLSKGGPYLIVVFPFVILEVTLGIASLFFEVLLIPPWTGIGVLLHLIALNSGLVALVFWNHRELSQPRQ
jgi:hypothetical protein